MGQDAAWYWRILRDKVLFSYGVDAAKVLDPQDLEFRPSSRTPLRLMSVFHRIYGPLASVREDGSLAITPCFASLLLRVDGFKESCVVVDEDSVEPVSRGMSVMSGHVKWVGSNVRPGLDVCVLSPEGELLAVGTCVLPRALAARRGPGPFVKVRARAGRQNC